ncbi:hypothetical protein C8E83_0565 [Frondihabitans australicus]|uniref:Uncharacterized protein n=1 Tax=Frondihabitans australicus TaxID=386892 RepID=A0A495IC21_9MICO|nr:hypothetical protein C8E83_0565 [Frondihabitans australicus]
MGLLAGLVATLAPPTSSSESAIATLRIDTDELSTGGAP